jgi:hypothetical protein
VKHGRLEIRRQFFSLQVIDGWNKIPAIVKIVKNVRPFGKPTNRRE